MHCLQIVVVAMLSVTACAAENAAAGKWNCSNSPDSGTQSAWTLVVREDGAKLTGFLTDGQIELPLVEVKAGGGRFTFGFEINGKPYRFEGKVEGRKLEGRYSGEEAAGRLQCTQ
jgi:hypothetical protein